VFAMENILSDDFNTLTTLCSEMGTTSEESKQKLDEIKDRLEKLNQQHPVKATGANNFQYIDVKSMLLLNYCMSLQYYMICKAEGVNLDQHEIFERLAYLRLMIEKLKPLDKKVEYQVDKLLRAAVTQNQGNAILPNRQKKEDNLRYKPNLSNFDTKRVTDKVEAKTEHKDKEIESAEDQDSENVEDYDEDDGESSDEIPNLDPNNLDDMGNEEINSDDIVSDEIDSDELEKYTVAKQKALAKRRPMPEKEEVEEKQPEIYKAVKTNPVSMIDRKSKHQKQRERDSKRMNRVDLVRELKNDMLGLPEEVNYGVASGNKLLVDEDREDEELEMTHFRRINYTKKELKDKEKRRQRLGKSDYHGITDGFGDFKRIDEFMNKNYSDDENNQSIKQADKQKYLDEVRSRKRDKKSSTKFLDQEIDSDEAGNDITFKNLPPKRSKDFIFKL